MNRSILMVMVGAVAVSMLLASAARPGAQYLQPVGCIGLSVASCTGATGLLRSHIRQNSETYEKWPEKWEIASDSELARIRSLYPTRKGHWLSGATFVLFLEPNYGALHTCAPSEVIVTPEAIKSAVDMAYVVGYIDGACEGTAQETLSHARSKGL